MKTILELTFEVIACCKCGAHNPIESNRLKTLKSNAGMFYCSFCGVYQGWSETDYERKIKALNTEVANAKQRELWATEKAERARQDAEHFKRSRDAQKGQVTRLKNRAANGVCPCCNRYFANLHRHMNTKHPDFNQEESTL